jgi:hypothetical protein
MNGWLFHQKCEAMPVILREGVHADFLYQQLSYMTFAVSKIFNTTRQRKFKGQDMKWMHTCTSKQANIVSNLTKLSHEKFIFIFFSLKEIKKKY